MQDIFRRIASKISTAAGTAAAFLGALFIILVWLVTGPIFNFSNTWQLFINTGTTIITFLMVFLIQNTQNRDGRALQLKLDELIHSNKQARDSFIDLEDLTDEDMDELNNEFKRLHEHYADKPSHSMHKLHTKIRAEHQRRLGLPDIFVDSHKRNM